MRFYTQQHKHYCGIDLHAQESLSLHPQPGRRESGPSETRL